MNDKGMPAPAPKLSERADEVARNWWRQRLAEWQPFWALLSLVGLGFGLRLAVQWQVPLPFCWLRKLTGIPCPGCGCTRSLLAWSHFDLVGALRFNPLFFLACLGVGGWALVWGAGLLTNRSWAAALEQQARRRPLGRILAFLAVLNWLYLWLSLPK